MDDTTHELISNAEVIAVNQGMINRLTLKDEIIDLFS
jgi:hypothetical protein